MIHHAAQNITHTVAMSKQLMEVICKVTMATMLGKFKRELDHDERNVHQINWSLNQETVNCLRPEDRMTTQKSWASEKTQLCLGVRQCI